MKGMIADKEIVLKMIIMFDYTQQNSYSISHLVCTLGVVTVDNCRQYGESVT